MEEVPRFAWQQVILGKDVLRLDAVNEELKGDSRSVTYRRIEKEVDI